MQRQAHYVPFQKQLILYKHLLQQSTSRPQLPRLATFKPGLLIPRLNITLNPRLHITLNPRPLLPNPIPMLLNPRPYYPKS